MTLSTNIAQWLLLVSTEVLSMLGATRAPAAWPSSPSAATLSPRTEQMRRNEREKRGERWGSEGEGLGSLLGLI